MLCNLASLDEVSYVPSDLYSISSYPPLDHAEGVAEHLHLDGFPLLVWVRKIIYT